MSLSIYGTPKHGTNTKVVQGAFAWSTTDAGGELDCGGLRVITGIFFTPVIGTGGSHDPQDFIEIQETLATDGTLHVPSTGAITLARASSGSSATHVLYTIFGY